MRRYAVRVLVAVLTFCIGLALSLALGLFKPHKVNSQYVSTVRIMSCSRKPHLVRPAFITVDSQPADPLALIYLGTSWDSNDTEARMQFSVENRSSRTVSGYVISADELWGADGKGSEKHLEWTSFEVLEPGGMSTTTLPRGAEGFSIRVVRISFRDGSTWINPRVPPQVN